MKHIVKRDTQHNKTTKFPTNENKVKHTQNYRKRDITKQNCSKKYKKKRTRCCFE